MRCPSCGHETSEGVQSCPKCGARLGEAPPAPVGASRAPTLEAAFSGSVQSDAASRDRQGRRKGASGKEDTLTRVHQETLLRKQRPRRLIRVLALLGLAGTLVLGTEQLFTGFAHKWQDPRTGITLILVKPGTFRMGSPLWPTEGPAHDVEITKPFYLGETEVTQAQWQRVMGSNPSNWKGNDLPVEQVSWEDAMEFCRKTGYRLPTEAEWEYACRAGSTTRFSFGDAAGDLGAYAWYDGNREKRTHPVSQKKPNAWGFLDMHGNVWEWCADWYAGDYYGHSPRQNPKGPSSGSVRVSRGGSWRLNPWFCRSATRGAGAPSDRDDNSGFRVARTP